MCVKRAEQPAAYDAEPLPAGMLSAHPWLTFVVPFAVFILFSAVEPKPPDPTIAAANAGSGWLDMGIEYRHYPLVYTLKLLATVGAIMLVLAGYRTFPLRISLLASVVGIGGGIVWIWLSRLHLEPKLLGSIGLGGILEHGQRSAFNPLTELSGAWAYGFLAIRLVGLVLVVPVIEEFFLRGFLMRFVMDAEWWKLPFGQVNATALVVGTLIPMLYHPEMLAALVWFSAVSYLMVKRRNIWDCVLAHALTNLLLGVYVLRTGHWQLM